MNTEYFYHSNKKKDKLIIIPDNQIILSDSSIENDSDLNRFIGGTDEFPLLQSNSNSNNSWWNEILYPINPCKSESQFSQYYIYWFMSINAFIGFGVLMYLLN